MTRSHRLMLTATIAFVSVIVLVTGSADASTIAGINTGNGSLDTLISSLGINTTFSFGNLLGGLVKWGGGYVMAHSIFELHDAWKQRQYRAQDFVHLLTGAGGTGVAIGGAAMYISNFIGQGSGSLLP